MIAIIIIILALAAVGVWNFVPAVRDKIRGWSTIAEAVLGGVLYYFGIVSEALQEGAKAGYIPSQWVSYVPIVLLAWMILKRVQTKTPVGKKP